jgi:hypothetical protein
MSGRVIEVLSWISTAVNFSSVATRAGSAARACSIVRSRPRRKKVTSLSSKRFSMALPVTLRCNMAAVETKSSVLGLGALIRVNTIVRNRDAPVNFRFRRMTPA